MKQKLVGFLMSAILAAGMLAGCGGDGSTAGSSANASASGSSEDAASSAASGSSSEKVESGDTIVIGGSADISGSMAAYGAPAADGMKVAVEEINANGGINGKQVELLMADTQSTDTVAQQVVNKYLYDDQVDVLIGEMSSSAREAVRVTVDKAASTPFFYTCHYEGGVADHYTFCSGESNTDMCMGPMMIGSGLAGLCGALYAPTMNVTPDMGTNFIVQAYSVVFIWGYGGAFSFGQAAFFGLGAYGYNIIAGNVGTAGFTPVAAVLAILLVGAFATIIGYFLYYGGVNDVFAGIITLCITLALNSFLAQTGGSQWRIGKVALGGYNGMTNIPPVSFGGLKLEGTALYYVVAVLTIAFTFVLLHLRRGYLGYTLAAVRENRDRSSLLGYNVPFVQTMMFGAGGAIAALGGILYACWGSYVAPSSLDMTSATIPVVLVATAGKTSPTASAIFTFIYYFITNKLAVSGNEYAKIILGVILVVVVTLMPKGLFKAIFDWIDGLFRKEQQK